MQLTLPLEVQLAVDSHKEQFPELFDIPENTLKERLVALHKKIDSTSRMLRIRFWEEYDRVAGKQMVMVNVYRSICEPKVFYHILRDPLKAAWILCAPASMLGRCGEQLDLLMERLSEVAEKRPVKANGEVDIKLAKLQFEMMMYFDQRKNGAIVQRVENRTMSVTANVQAGSEAERKLVESFSDEELLKRLEDAKRRLPKPPIEVKAE